MPQRPAACLIQRRDDDDSEVRGRASTRGESWIPPLGPAAMCARLARRPVLSTAYICPGYAVLATLSNALLSSASLAVST